MRGLPWQFGLKRSGPIEAPHVSKKGDMRDERLAVVADAEFIELRARAIDGGFQWAINLAAGPHHAGSRKPAETVDGPVEPIDGQCVARPGDAARGRRINIANEGERQMQIARLHRSCLRQVRHQLTEQLLDCSPRCIVGPRCDKAAHQGVGVARERRDVAAIALAAAEFLALRIASTQCPTRSGPE